MLPTEPNPKAGPSFSGTKKAWANILLCLPIWLRLKQQKEKEHYTQTHRPGPIYWPTRKLSKWIWKLPYPARKLQQLTSKKRSALTESEESYIKFESIYAARKRSSVSSWTGVGLEERKIRICFLNKRCDTWVRGASDPVCLQFCSTWFPQSLRFGISIRIWSVSVSFSNSIFLSLIGSSSILSLPLSLRSWGGDGLGPRSQ